MFGKKTYNKKAPLMPPPQQATTSLLPFIAYGQALSFLPLACSFQSTTTLYSTPQATQTAVVLQLIDHFHCHVHMHFSNLVF